MALTDDRFDQLIDISKEVFRTSSLNDATIEQIDEKQIVVQTTWSQMDIEKNERTKFEQTYLFDKTDSTTMLVHKTKPLPIRNSVYNISSNDNQLNAIVTDWKNNSEENQFLEIWKNGVRVQNVNLTKLNKHGKIYENSGLLGSFVWSPDSSKIAYIAEAKQINKEKCIYNSKVSQTSQNKPSENDSITVENYEQKYSNYYSDDWGEQYVGKAKTVIAVFDVASGEFNIFDKFQEGFIPAQACWYKNDALVYCAYNDQPYKLGLIYCPIRKSELFYFDLKKNEHLQLTDLKTESVRDPRFSSDFENLCWLQNQAKGPHFQSSQLMIMKWSTKETNVLIDIVKDPKGKLKISMRINGIASYDFNEKDDEFPGIFAIKFPKNCWSRDNTRLLVDTQWRRSNRIVCIDLKSAHLTVLNNQIPLTSSCSVLSFSNDWICASIQAYNQKPFLAIGKLPQRGNEHDLRWTFTETRDEFMDLATVELIQLTPKLVDPKFSNLTFESILVQATKQRNNTLVVFPHGGPHSCYCSDFSQHVAVFYKLGYSVLLINYRGSSGYGQNSIDCLPGKIAEYDVSDCQQAAEFVMSKYNFKNAVVYGGSHGGFLTTQLIGQYPDFYEAAATRNPVTHLEAMLFSTDIPDWIICEGFGRYEFDFKITGNPSLYDELYKRSPISHIDKVKTPTLLMIGNVDLRVPPTQGKQYYKALVSRNVPTKLVCFKEDNHPLDRPQTTVDCIILTILWYEKYVKSI